MTEIVMDRSVSNQEIPGRWQMIIQNPGYLPPWMLSTKEAFDRFERAFNYSKYNDEVLRLTGDRKKTSYLRPFIALSSEIAMMTGDENLLQYFSEFQQPWESNEKIYLSAIRGAREIMRTTGDVQALTNYFFTFLQEGSNTDEGDLVEMVKKAHYNPPLKREKIIDNITPVPSPKIDMPAE